MLLFFQERVWVVALWYILLPYPKFHFFKTGSWSTAGLGKELGILSRSAKNAWCGKEI
jgi:hypothetical protein